MKRGFTLIEMLCYIGILGVLLGAVSSFLLFTVRSQTKTRAESEVTFQASRAMEIMTREIKQATGIYSPTTVFDSHPGQLSLATGATYTDFFLCGTQICQKRESQNPVAITSGAVQTQNLVFHAVNSASPMPSVQIDLTVASQTSSITLTSTASLR